jgi:hypothetical protein
LTSSSRTIWFTALSWRTSSEEFCRANSATVYRCSFFPRPLCPHCEKQSIDKLNFAAQSIFMETDWAVKNLQVIRTLMERGAVYRRALAPVMGAVGLTGMVAGVLAAALKVRTAEGLIFLSIAPGGSLAIWLLVPGWMVLYGCALHAAGFFMPRGFKLFGWAFIGAGCFLGAGLCLGGPPSAAGVNWAMGALFGGSHLAYGVYLYFTEKDGNAA